MAELKKFTVHVREVHVQDVEVMASCYEDAISMVQDGQGDRVDDTLEYSCTLDPDDWTISGPGDEWDRPCKEFIKDEDEQDEDLDNDDLHDTVEDEN